MDENHNVIPKPTQPKKGAHSFAIYQRILALDVSSNSKMGLFSERKTYSAISSETESLLAKGVENDPAKLLNLVELIRNSGSGHSGGQEAGRVLRKRIKHGSPSEQMRALSLVEIIVENGVKTEPFISLSGLGEQLMQVAASHAGHANVEISKSAKATRQCRVLLQAWSSRNDQNISRLFRNAGLVSKSEHWKDRSSFHPDDDLDDEVFGQAGGSHSRSHSRSHQRNGSSISITGFRKSAMVEPRFPQTSCSHLNESSPSRSPSPVNLRGASLETTVATAHNIAARLANSLIASPDGSHEIDVYHQQAKQLRHRIIKLVHSPSAEVQEYLGQLLSANEELIASLQAYDVVIEGHGAMTSQEDHEIDGVYHAAPIKPVRPPPSPPRKKNSSSDLVETTAPFSDSLEHRPSDSFDPFGDDNEQLERPKHTPMW